MIKIVAVACQMPDWLGDSKGLLVLTQPAPARHGDVLCAYSVMTGDVFVGEQGFLTNEGDFVSRHKAMKIAEAAGQLLQKVFSAQLFSEDLW